MKQNNLHTKFSTLNVLFISSNFADYGSFKLGYFYKIVISTPVTLSGECKRMNENRVECQLLGSVSLDFVRSGPSYMHRCHAFPLRQ